MGTYTGIRFEAKLKPDVADAINIASDRLIRGKINSTDQWWFLVCFITDIPADSAFMHDYRRTFIPFGAISYMPDDWIERPDMDCNEDNIWKVSCSLKNYQGTIEKFVEQVLPYMIEEPCEVETRFEYDDDSEFVTVLPR